MLSRLSSFSGPLSPLFKIPVGGFTTGGLILRYVIGDTDSYSGTGSVIDLVGNSNATLYNGSTYSINGYINFDGANDYLSTNTSLNSKLSPANTSTIISHFIWVYPTDNGVIISEIGQTTSNILWHDSQIEIVGGNLKFGLWTGIGGVSSLNSSISTPFYNWHYVGLTYDGATMRGYVNGQLAGTKNLIRDTPYNLGSTGLHYAIATADTTSLGDGSPSKMKLGDFHVYNIALTQQQILNNYNYTKSDYIYTGSMSIWIDANDPESFSGGSVNDLSGNNYTHTLTSGATSSTIFGFKSFDCTTGLKRIEVNGTGPTLPTTGYTYVAWARLISNNFSSYRTLLYTNVSGDKYTPITIPNGTNTLGWWDINGGVFRTSGYGLTSSVDVWVQYAVVGDNSSHTYYINDTQVGNTIPYGIGTTTHWGLGNNALAGQPFGYVGNMMFYRKKLTQVEIKQNYDALKNVYKNGDFVVDNLKLYFNPASYLSYPSSGTTVTDLTGNSLNGTLSNITFTNPYFTFNGSNSQIVITDNSLLEPGSGDWTMEVWINVSNFTGSRVVLGKIAPGGNSSDISYAIRILNGNIRADFNSGAFSAVSTANYALTLNTWYQFTYVFNNVSNNNIISYVNGQFSSTTTHSYTSLQNTSTNLHLGSYNGGATFQQWFSGKMGIVRIYSSALSDSDVLQNYNANAELYGLERYDPQIVTDGLLLQLDANDNSSYPGAGTTWYDMSGAGNDMTLVDTPTFVSGAISYFDFNGINEYATGTGVTVPTTSYTKSVWFWLDAYVVNNIVSGFNGVGGHFLFMGNSTKILVGHHNQGVAFNTYQSSSSINLNTWYNVTVTFSTTSGFKIYINGQLDSSHNMTLAHLGSGTTNLGSYSNSGDNFLNGRISKVYTYNKVLSATEILQNFDADRYQFGI
jgi:hypothetical protein